MTTKHPTIGVTPAAPLDVLLEDPLHGEFSFDAWQVLAQQDPIAFEAKRRALMHACIDNSSDPNTLTRLQAELDLLRIGRCSQAHALTEMTQRCTRRMDGLLLVAHELQNLANVLRKTMKSSGKTAGNLPQD